MIGQPQLVAEMVAGLLIGPSVFGWLAPDLQRAIVPTESLHPLYVCSQVGLAQWITDVVGIHTVFGAFMLGVAVPRGVFTRYLQAAIEPLAAALFLPPFFVYTGLNTRLTLVNSAPLWTMTWLLFGAACAGKASLAGPRPGSRARRPATR